MPISLISATLRLIAIDITLVLLAIPLHYYISAYIDINISLLLHTWLRWIVIAAIDIRWLITNISATPIDARCRRWCLPPCCLSVATATSPPPLSRFTPAAQPRRLFHLRLPPCHALLYAYRRARETGIAAILFSPLIAILRHTPLMIFINTYYYHYKMPIHTHTSYAAAYYGQPLRSQSRHAICSRFVTAPAASRF